MTTLLISDLHLDRSRPAVTRRFLEFLADEAPGAEALYILGDLFEAWVGDDDPDPHHEQIAAALKALGARDTPVFFVAGNRDFLLGRDYAQRAGMKLLVEPLVLPLGGVRTLLLHGDVLCTDDVEYQRFREAVRSPAWQKEFLARPLAERRAMAAEARAASRKRGTDMAQDIMDVNPEAVLASFRAHAVTRMIHGHTHRPAVHHLSVDGAPCERIVLGDWYEQGSVLRVAADGSARLGVLPLS